MKREYKNCKMVLYKTIQDGPIENRPIRMETTQEYRGSDDNHIIGYFDVSFTSSYLKLLSPKNPRIKEDFDTGLRNILVEMNRLDSDYLTIKLL